MNIGIAGAGLLGRVLALFLHKRGDQVTLFDKESLESTDNCGFTAAGMLSPYTELETGNTRVFDLGIRSIELWPQLILQLDSDIYFRKMGSFLTAHPQDAASAQRLIRLINRKLEGETPFLPLTSKDALALEPEIDLKGESYFFPDEGQIDSQGFMDAVCNTLAAEVSWNWNTPVAQVSAHNIELASGEKHSFDWVFDCRGTGAKSNLPQVRGVRGEVIQIHTEEIKLNRPVRVMHPRYRIYIVPRPENIFLIGASEIESEDYSPVSLRSTLELLSAAYSLHPAFAEARILSMKTQCRPALPDNLPFIQHEQGLTMLNGLFRHGYLLAPALVEEALTYMP